MTDIPESITRSFLCETTTKWIALSALPSAGLKGFRTTRIGKLTKRNEVEFSIGATQRGCSLNLNDSIRRIIEAAGAEPISRNSTGGDPKEYPAFSLDTIPALKSKEIFDNLYALLTALPRVGS